MKNTDDAKLEIQELFETEPDDEHDWSEQGVFEHARKVILKWNAIDDKG